MSATHTHFPGPPLSEYVDFFWLSEGYAPSHTTERVLPSATMGLVISLVERGGFGGVTGPRSASFLLNTSTPISLIGVSFKPGGGFPFFHPPACELRDTSIPLDLLWPSAASGLHERLLEAGDSASRFRLLELALLGHLNRQRKSHPAVAFALASFADVHRTRTVAEITDCIGLSPRRFIELFRDQVGLTPKVFSRLSRFRQALALIEAGGDIDWSDLALGCGYYDQAHFIHDFQAFAGLSPTQYQNRRLTLNHVRMTD